MPRNQEFHALKLTVSHRETNSFKRWNYRWWGTTKKKRYNETIPPYYWIYAKELL